MENKKESQLLDSCLARIIQSHSTQKSSHATKRSHLMESLVTTLDAQIALALLATRLASLPTSMHRLASSMALTGYLWEFHILSSLYSLLLSTLPRDT